MGTGGRYKVQDGASYKVQEEVLCEVNFPFFCEFFRKGPLHLTVEDYRIYKIKAEQSCVGFGSKILVNRFYHELFFKKGPSIRYN